MTPWKGVEGGRGWEEGPDTHRAIIMATAYISLGLLCVHGTLVNLEPAKGTFKVQAMCKLCFCCNWEHILAMSARKNLELNGLQCAAWGLIRVPASRRKQIE